MTQRPDFQQSRAKKYINFSINPLSLASPIPEIILHLKLCLIEGDSAGSLETSLGIAPRYNNWLQNFQGNWGEKNLLCFLNSLWRKCEVTNPQRWLTLFFSPACLLQSFLHSFEQGKRDTMKQISFNLATLVAKKMLWEWVWVLNRFYNVSGCWLLWAWKVQSQFRPHSKWPCHSPINRAPSVSDPGT